MKFSKTVSFCTLLVGSLFTFQANAAVIACSNDDVKITSFRVLDGTESTAVDFSASSCLGVFKGNNSSFVSPSQDSATGTLNLGYMNSGWLNTNSYNNWWTTEGAFTDESELQNLAGNGNVDPGWVYVGKAEQQKGSSSGFQGATMSDGNSSYTFEDSLLTLSDCKGKDNEIAGCYSGEATSGTWSWTPPTTNPSELLSLLGGEFFDKVAVIFKAANSFAMYEFDLEDLGLSAVMEGDYNYSFGGTWDMSTTLVKERKKPKGDAFEDHYIAQGLSNLSVWARDPIEAQEVPEPATYLMMLLALAGLSATSRRSKKLSM